MLGRNRLTSAIRQTLQFDVELPINSLRNDLSPLSICLRLAVHTASCRKLVDMQLCA